MGFVELSEEETFNIVNGFTWGVVADKYGGYKVPLIVGDHVDVPDEIMKLVEKYSTKDPFYGKSKTLYLRLKNLTTKQREELVNKMGQKVHIVFKLTGLFEKDDKEKIRCFKVTGLRRLEPIEEEEECAGHLDELYNTNQEVEMEDW